MRTLVAIMTTALLLIAGACGSSDDSDDTTQAPPSDQSDPTESPDGDTDDDSVQDVIDDLDFGDGAARITVGDREYTFSLGGNSTVGGTTYLGVCQTLFGLITGGGYDPDGRAITMDFEIPPADWQSYEDGRFDAPFIVIESDAEGEPSWAADQTGYADPGDSQIDEWESDGSRATGTATFIEVLGFGGVADGAQPIEGTFDISCGEE